MKNQREVLFALIRGALLGDVPDAATAQAASAYAEQLYRVSKGHDVAHLLSYAIDRFGVSLEDENIARAFKRQLMTALLRYERLRYEQSEIVRVLQEASIPFIPLKGAVLREIYPGPWMRTSCDIDVLVHEEDLERAKSALTQALSYQVRGEKTYHDISLVSADGVLLELHFHIQTRMPGPDQLLSRVWDYATPRTPGSYEYVLSPEFLTFHLVTHAAGHILSSGFGIRILLDLYLLYKRSAYDEAAFRALACTAGIEIFYNALMDLSRVWLEGQEHSDLTRELEDYVITSGSYGNRQNQIALQYQDEKMVSYLWHRVFMPYSLLCVCYPELKGKPWLTPVYQIRRWCAILFRGRATRAIREVSVVSRVADQRIKSGAALLEQLGLKYPKS